MVIWSPKLIDLMKSFVINEQNFKQNILIQDLQGSEFNARIMAQLN